MASRKVLDVWWFYHNVWGKIWWLKNSKSILHKYQDILAQVFGSRKQYRNVNWLEGRGKVLRKYSCWCNVITHASKGSWTTKRDKKQRNVNIARRKTHSMIVNLSRQYRPWPGHRIVKVRWFCWNRQYTYITRKALVTAEARCIANYHLVARVEIVPSASKVCAIRIGEYESTKEEPHYVCIDADYPYSQ